jgi:hypothetical protein
MAASEDEARNCGDWSEVSFTGPRGDTQFKAPRASALPRSMAPDATDPIAAYRWGRWVIAWGLRRSMRLVRRGYAWHALRIMRRLASVAPKLPSVQLYLARLACGLGDLATARRAADRILFFPSAKTHRFHCRFAAIYLRHRDFEAAEAMP